MEFELGSGFLTMIDRDTGESFELGKVTPMEMEVEEWSNKEEPERVIKGFANPGMFSCEVTTTFNEELFSELCKPSTSSEFTIEYETPIIMQARRHKKARIRKKWLKRYGYKEDKVKTIMKAKYGSFNGETGECDIVVESIEYKLKPYQLCREVREWLI